MLHLIWYIIVGSIVGGLVTHLFSRPKEGAQFHPAGIIVSILGALLVLWLWHKYKLHIPTAVAATACHAIAMRRRVSAALFARSLSALVRACPPRRVVTVADSSRLAFLYLSSLKRR